MAKYGMLAKEGAFTLHLLTHMPQGWAYVILEFLKRETKRIMVRMIISQLFYDDMLQ